jgi:DNA-binding CsgD family transcriptional regulator
MAHETDHIRRDDAAGGLSSPVQLVGRERERRLLDSMVAAVTTRGAALVVCGEPGVGKSALLDHAATAASGGSTTVLRARGIESEVVLPYATIADLILPLRHLFDVLPRQQRRAIKVCLGMSPDAVGNQYVACAAVLNLLSAAAERRPLVVLVDDLQFVDPPSRRVLLFVARRLSAEHLIMVFADRGDPEAARPNAALGRLNLAGLSEPECDALLRRHGFDTSSGLVHRLRPLCGGNPLALIELAATASSSFLSGTPSPDVPDPGRYLQRVWSRRLVDLPQATQAALTVLACSRSGRTPRVDAALAATGLTLAALAPAEAAGLVSATEQAVEFRHPVLRAVILRSTPLAQRLAAYRSLALTSSGPLRAWYLAAAATGPDEHAANALTAAAHEARRQGAFEGSAAAWRRAAELTDDPDVRAERLLNAAGDAFLGGASTDAAAWAEEALRQSSGPAAYAAAQLLRSHVYTWIGQPSTAHELLAAGAATIRGRDPARAGCLLAAAVRPAVMDAKIAVAVSYAQQAALLSGHPPPVETMIGLGQARMMAGDVVGARAVLPTVHSASATLDPIRDQHQLALLAQCLSWADEPGDARPLVTTLIDAAQQAGAPAGLPYALAVRGEIDMWAGRWAAACADLTEALRWAVELEQASAIGGVLAFLARLDALRGNRARCEEHITRARREVGPYGIGCLEFYFSSALGSVALAHGDYASSVDHLERSFRLARDAHMGNPVAVPFAADLVEAYLRLGQRREALETVAWLRERAATTRLAWPLAAAERCDGLLSVTSDQAEAHFDAARAAHRRREMPFEVGRTHLARGEALRRFRRPSAARPALEAAFAAFETLGAKPWEQRAAAELAAAGYRPDDRSNGGTLDRLSPQELQVARAIARGMNNNEAASALFVSRKTVEAHLTRAYRKLGVRSRTDLTRVLTSEGLPD